MDKIKYLVAKFLYLLVTGRVYLIVSHISGTLVGLIVVAVLLVLGYGLPAFGWGFLTYAGNLILGMFTALLDPFGISSE